MANIVRLGPLGTAWDRLPNVDERCSQRAAMLPLLD